MKGTPVGLNAFMVKAAIPQSCNLTLSDVFLGNAPFFVLETVIVVILIAFPALSLFVPYAR